MAKENPNTYSSKNLSIPKSAPISTDYTSTKAFNKSAIGGERRAPEYKLENLKK